jgi:hypothetical protein
VREQHEPIDAHRRTGRAADRQTVLDFGAQEFVDLEIDALIPTNLAQCRFVADRYLASFGLTFPPFTARRSAFQLPS